MKKLRIILILTAVLSVQTPAYAQLNPTGALTGSASGQAWMAKMTAQARVEQLLRDNYAFADRANFAWIENEKVNMERPAYISENEMYIPSGFAQKVLSVTEEDEYIAVSYIAEKMGYYYFFDPTGFAMISKTENAVNTEEGNTQGYADYYTVSDAIGTLSWTDVKKEEFDRAAYLKKWQGLLTVPAEYKGSAVDQYQNEYLPKTAVGTDGNGGIYAGLNLDVNKGNVPFTDINLDSYITGDESADRYNRHKTEYTDKLSSCYKRLFVLGQYYHLIEPENTKLRTEIIAALDYLLDNHYSKIVDLYTYSAKDKSSKGSWTVYQMTIPLKYSNTLCLVSEGMSHDKLIRHTNAIFDRSIDPTIRNGGSSTYEYFWNRLCRTLGYFNTAVLADDYERMNYAMRYLNQIFMTKPDETSKLSYPTDGFYSDGSMLFHGTVPYNMGYGNSYVSTVSEMITLTENTPFSLERVSGFENLYSFLKNNFYPFVAENMKMHMVTGRGEVQDAHVLMKSALNIIAAADEETQKTLLYELKQAFAKYLGNYKNFEISSAVYDGYVISAAAEDIRFIKNVEALWDIVEEGPQKEACQVFYNMDRAVYRSADYTAGLSMSSERVQKYECILPKNSKGWYTGDGMLYLYTGDRKQYTSGYFDHINPYRIPGTTVDETLRSETATSGSMMSDESWAGGATDGSSAVCGYIMSSAPLPDVTEGIRLEGKKSYFFLNGRVVCIGSGITGGNGEVCTVVDNRLIDLK